jgi:glycogen(starch) synthase
MRVLFWSELFWPYIGGAEIVNAQLLSALRNRGYEFIVVTSHDYLDLPDEAHFEGIPVYRLPFRTALATGNVRQLVEARRQVSRIKRSFAADLVHLNSVGPSGLFHLQTHEAHPAPLLVTLQIEIPPSETVGRSTLFTQLLRSTNWVTGVSAAVLDQARGLEPRIIPRSSLIYNFLAEPPLLPTPLPVEAPRLLCLGRLTPQKGFDLAVTAFATVRRSFPNARLIIAGDGKERTLLEQQAVQLGVKEVVDFLGWVAPDTVPSLLNTATLVLMPSRFEGLPVVALQAELMARPIIATRIGGLSEIVVQEETGLLVEPEDSSSLAEAIVTLLTHPETAMRMGLAARRRAQAMFNMTQCVDAYDTLYQALIKKGIHEVLEES